MTGGAWLSPPVRKEIHAIASAWLASATGLVLVSVPRAGELWSIALGIYALGAVGMGALSIGHEYSDRTLATWLTLPDSRRRLLARKLLVLVTLLLTLGALAWMAFLRTAFAPDRVLPSLILPALGAAAVAPWLTMLSRGPLGGFVFTLTIPALVAAGRLLWSAAGHSTLADIAGRTDLAARISMPWWMAATICAIAAVAGWRHFTRLEVASRSLQATGWRAPAGRAAGTITATRIHPIRWLVEKELRLQQVTFVVTGAYVVVSLVLMAPTGLAPDLRTTFNAVAFELHGALVALLVGATASAEERGLGVSEWQTLLPMAGWIQWTLKVTVSLGLVAVLSTGVPVAIASVQQPGSAGISTLAGFALEFCPVFILISVVALYVSSLSRSGIRAFLGALPVAAVAVPGLVGVAQGVAHSIQRAYRLAFRTPGSSLLIPGAGQLAGAAAAVFIVGGVCVLALWFAMTNHRSLEHGAGRIARQVVVMAAALIIAISATAVITMVLAAR